jgi:hypothetical protein
MFVTVPNGADQRKVGDTAWSYVVIMTLALLSVNQSLVGAYHASRPRAIPSDAFISGRGVTPERHSGVVIAALYAGRVSFGSGRSAGGCHHP